MSISYPDYDTAPRGPQDAARHREKIREAIRDRIPEIISDEAIITQKGDKKVKVPVRGIKSYRFRHRIGETGGGMGTGESEKGKKLGKRPKDTGKPGQAGEDPGEDFLETEIDIAELIDMMFEDLGLPNLQKKEIRETIIPKGWKFSSVEKHGPWQRLDRKRTVIEAIKRAEAHVAILIEETGRTEEECRAALSLALGDLEQASNVLLDPNCQLEPIDEAVIIPEIDDHRFRTIKQDVEQQSNAVILAMMDVSASMGMFKKYLARSFYFWMVHFLRFQFKHVEIRFIAHHAEAKLVDEHEFFYRGESGGTRCASAYELATKLIDTEYPASKWNVYPFHFSDGEEFDIDHCVKALGDLLSRNVATFGYGEIQGDYSYSKLMEYYERLIPLQRIQVNGFNYFTGLYEQSPVKGVIVRGKEDIYPSLKAFFDLKKEGGA